MSDVTVAQTRKTRSWQTILIIVLLILLIISVAVLYHFYPRYLEMNKDIKYLEREAKMWELNFLNFYFFASRDWNEAEKYAINILLKSFSDKLAEENDWTAREQYQWELTSGKDYVQKILK